MTEQEKKSRKYNFKRIISGDILGEDFFFKQFKLYILLVVLMLFFINNKYSLSNKLLEMEYLKKNLIYVSDKNLDLLTELVPYSRLSKIEKLLEFKKMKFSYKIQIYELHK
ncbi:MAG: hypothetical protein LBC54_00740 [Bacteroidales bacterium OttesenSCG-928-I14]|nr:hypothetical protein [Bacteroidales bacterium OttesenSCG-928-I14]